MKPASSASKPETASRLDAATLARLARRTPVPLMRAALAGPGRAQVIAQIFRRMPAQLRPSPAKLDAVIRWDVADKGRATETWFLLFEEGGCRTTRMAPDATARTTFTLGALDLVRLATGAENPMQMFQSGRMKISGDLFFAAQLQSAFTIPA